MIFSVWKYLMDQHTNILVARSIVMLNMVFIQNFHVLNCRSEKNSIFATSLLRNPFIIITIICSILLQLLVIYVPTLSSFLKITSLSMDVVLASFVFSLVIIAVSEFYKFLYTKIKK